MAILKEAFEIMELEGSCSTDFISRRLGFKESSVKKAMLRAEQNGDVCRTDRGWKRLQKVVI